MRYIVFILIAAMLPVSAFAGTWSGAAGPDVISGMIISELEYRDARLIDVIRVISEMSGANIVATSSAAETTVTIYLKDVSVKHVIETICRINNLWYRQDGDTATYRIMTTEEYRKDLIVHHDDETKIFTLSNPNVELVANAIEDLYGDRVTRRQSGGSGSPGSAGFAGISAEKRNDDFNSVTNNSFFNSSGNNSSNSNSNSTGQAGKVKGELSIDQIAALTPTGGGYNQISADQLQALTAQEAPVYLTANFEHNLIIVRSSDKLALKSIQELIKGLDRPVPQVLLEMRIINVLVDDDFTSIFNYEIEGGAFSESTIPALLGNNALPGAGTFVFEYLNGRLRANMELMEQQNRVNILSSPMILASNNRPARLFVGDERVLVTGYNSVSNNTNVDINGNIISDNSENIVPETSVQEIGNTIEIIPFINADGTITLNIQQESSDVRTNGAIIPVVSEGKVLNLPIDAINTARLQGTIIAKDNLTIAVGGLTRTTYSNNERKIPLLGDLPVIGTAFTSTQESEEKSELVLLITPHIVRLPGTQSAMLPKEPEKPLMRKLNRYKCSSKCIK
ncbi:hypothetical protein H8E50_03980 [bacterium]|nr:hypothetical protein [bacterium]